MQKTDASNTLFNLAADLVNHTSRHVFITGKAGTGKTTFLKFIKESTQKNAVVVAPTGVAAINAGGVTMHSFFQLPFGPFVPGTVSGFTNNNVATDKHSLFRNIHFTTAKRELLQELELLIIDEVSMVRCDMLDAMDTILRHFRRQPFIPFGGVQVIYIGDLFQLPPVIPQQEWNILQNYYESPFFFASKAIKEAQPLYIELKKIYRQNEQHFIDILNRVRNNVPLSTDLQELNKKYNPEFNAPAGQKYITLSTHNRKADVINEGELKKLPGKLYSFKAELSGDFSDKALPTEIDLQLKEGAQVMFIKNDSGTERRYYNGKLAIVKKILNNEIFVSFNNGEPELKLEKETWKNVRYNYNKEKDNIEEEELGSFIQYPIRLAWAITIHKSQGLTFEKAVIDAGSSFAAGQVYVALSRCTSLEGLVLHSRIFPHSIATDPKVLEFAQREANDEYLEKLLKEEKLKFQGDVLIKAFNWQKPVKAILEWKELIPGKKLPNPEEALNLNKDILDKARQQAGIAEKFVVQLQQVLASGNTDLLLQRVNKAIPYLAKAMVDEVLHPMQQHLSSLQYASKVKKYYKEVQMIEGSIISHLQKLNNLQYGDMHFVTYAFESVEHRTITKEGKKVRAEKGASHRDSLVLFREGKSLTEICALRNLALGTIESHLASFVYSGEIDVHELVSESKTKAILDVIEDMGMTATSIKQKLGDEFTFGEIRAVMNFYRRIEEQKKETVTTV
jgi:hypothetical protein